MSPKYSLCTWSTIYVLEYYLCPLRTVHVPRVDYMFQEYSLCPQSTVYVSRILFMSLEYSLCPRVDFMFL